MPDRPRNTPCRLYLTRIIPSPGYPSYQDLHQRPGPCDSVHPAVRMSYYTCCVLFCLRLVPDACSAGHLQLLWHAALA